MDLHLPVLLALQSNSNRWCGATVERENQQQFRRNSEVGVGGEKAFFWRKESLLHVEVIVPSAVQK